MAFSRVLKRLAGAAAGLLLRRFRGFVGLHVPARARPSNEAAEAWFETRDGRRIPVFPDYRYKVKPGWRYFKELQLLAALEARGRLTPDESALLRRAAGRRTLGVSLDEIRARLESVVLRVEDLLLPSGGGVPALRPSDGEIQAAILGSIAEPRRLLETMRALAGVDFARGSRLLEIGFSSGGSSLFAFERLGFEVWGIDNDFGGLHQHPGLAEYVAERLRSKVALRGGDITRETQLAPGSFDLVYSASVLEHITDLRGAAREMFRLLKPGGSALHLYHSFFAPSGGHALGIFDSPWGHLRVGDEAFRYFDELRPFEAEAAKGWWTRGLNRAPLGEVQGALLAAGFRLRLVQRSLAPEAHLEGLTPELAAECLAHDPRLSLEDLVTETVLLLADKP